MSKCVIYIYIYSSISLNFGGKNYNCHFLSSMEGKLNTLLNKHNEKQQSESNPIAYTQPNPVRYKTVFASNINPFTTSKLFSPIGKVKPNEEEEEKTHTPKENTEDDSSFEVPSGTKYGYKSDSNEENKSEEDESDSEYNSDGSNPEVVDVEDDESDEEVLDSLEDDLDESRMLEDDLNVPLSVLRETSFQAKRFSIESVKKEKKHKRLCSSIIKILKFPLKLFSLFWLTMLVLSLILSRVTYYYIV